jgi:hypothetical protein
MNLRFILNVLFYPQTQPFGLKEQNMSKRFNRTVLWSSIAVGFIACLPLVPHAVAAKPAFGEGLVAPTVLLLKDLRAVTSCQLEFKWCATFTPLDLPPATEPEPEVMKAGSDASPDFRTLEMLNWFGDGNNWIAIV